MSGCTNKRGSAAATAVSVAAFAAGFWVLIMSAVLGTEKDVELPKQLARHQSSQTLVWISENRDVPVTAPARNRMMRGETGSEVATLLWPTRTTRLSSTFGWRVNPVTGENQIHRGVDIPAPCGTEVRAVEDGVVTFADWTDSSGNTLSVTHEGGWITRYAHLSKLTVLAGQRVAAGELIGFTGDTGKLCTGPHLHFEIWTGHTAVDPMAFRFREQTGPAVTVAAAACGTSRRAATNAVGSMDVPRSSEVEAQYSQLVGHR
jgi:murein DD-endopeptidase MepM/ murein hydrolase activator NlpD